MASQLWGAPGSTQTANIVSIKESREDVNRPVLDGASAVSVVLTPGGIGPQGGKPCVSYVVADRHRA